MKIVWQAEIPRTVTIIHSLNWQMIQGDIKQNFYTYTAFVCVYCPFHAKGPEIYE